MLKKLNLSRRRLILAAAVSALIVASPNIVRAALLGHEVRAQTFHQLEHGQVTVTNFGNVNIHSYQSPEVIGCVTTHIIETPERLVFFDAQRSVIFDQEIREYSEALGKLVDRFIIHLHPDHWFGAHQFREVPIYSLVEIMAEINQSGEFFIEISLPSLGHHVPPSKVVPTNVIQRGASKIIDCAEFERRYVCDAEADNFLTIYMPQQQSYIVQDLLYNNCHQFCGHCHFDSWINQLKGLRHETGFEHILPGHGSNDGSRQSIDDAIIYLELVKRIYETTSSGAALRAAILERYPSYRAAAVVDIQNLFLYPGSQ
ncbi:hypothetical protein [uncultured Tateyamaria sp.]|uniref:hypothetical protein n=1 Tax=uncultured Tateyamaria sp. TaxID=455651 RepID=UPI00260C4900|nr:hypothetical protein [uncultured Tateyamaria sp.]